jgi:Tol biopolymer transport system component
MRIMMPVFLTAASAASLCADGAAQSTQLLSHTSVAQSDSTSGAEASTGLLGWSMSRDGRYVVFSSFADNLVPGDTNASADIFLYDRQSGSVTRVSTNGSGGEANGASYGPTMTADDRYVVFHSFASNLVANDLNGTADVFMKDLLTGSVTLVSMDSNGHQLSGVSLWPSVSADGRFVSFETFDASANAGHVYVRDVLMHTLTIADTSAAGEAGNGESSWPSISDDGRYVGFWSTATNLGIVPDPGRSPSFLHDMHTGATVPLNAGSEFAPAVSADGRYVAYDTDEYPNPHVWLHDIQAGTDTLLDSGAMPTISVDNRYVVYLTSPYTQGQVIVHDLQSGTASVVSAGPGGVLGDKISFPRANAPCISMDDRFVTFAGAATNLVPGDTNGAGDVFVSDLQTGAITRVSVSGSGVPSNGNSIEPSMSADGRYLAFTSNSTDIVPSDTNAASDVFVLDRQTESTVRASVASNGTQGNLASGSPAITPDGRWVAFWSSANNLVAGDTNGTIDIFVRDLQLGTTTRVSLDSTGVQANGASTNTYPPAISADGRYVVFASDATNLVAGDTNGSTDVFVHDLQTGATTRMSVDSTGAQGNSSSTSPAISADGRYVVFQSGSTNLAANDTNGTWDVFVHDRQTGVTKLVSVNPQGAASNGFSASFGRAVSSDGRYVAFVSYASDLVSGDTNFAEDVFVRDMVAGVTTRVDLGPNAVQSNGFFCEEATISPDGRFVAFTSLATNLVTGDTNNAIDVFLRDRVAGTTELVSLSSSGAQGNSGSGTSGSSLALSADGRLVAFASAASNLVANDMNGSTDVFLRDRGAGSSFVSTCFGDGTGAACPCANTGLPGHGCQNSGSTGGALLSGSGVASLSADSVHLTSSGEMPNSSSIVLQGDAVIAQIPFGNGLRCTGGHLKRPYTANASGGVLNVPPTGQPSFSARSAALGDPIQAGSTRIYQVYYHDPNLTFCPNGFNVSNAIVVEWGN